MKAGAVVALVLAGTAPVALSEMTPDEEGDLMATLFAKAEEIAQRDFGQSAALSVSRTWTDTTRVGAFGETIRADPGYHFAFARVSVHNTGKIDLAVSTWHFYAIDEWGDERPALLGGAHDDFNAGRVRAGGSIGGTVGFDVMDGSTLVGIGWQGDLANATAPWGPGEEKANP